MPSDDARLIRLEDKVDQIGAALVQIARLDERIITLFNNHTTILNRIDAAGQALSELHERLDDMERILAGHKPLFTWMDRGAVAAMTAGVGWAIAKFTGKIP